MSNLHFSSPDWHALEKRCGENLPHWHCERAIYHVSFRFADSVPKARRDQWLAERRNILDNIMCQNREPTESEHKRLHNLYSEKIESYLNAGHGECWLRSMKARDVVTGALEYFNEERYRLHAYCVMPNHVHALVEPLPGWDLSKITQTWTSFTSTGINKIAGRKGRLWQQEPYDHIVRSEKEYRFLFEYIWENPGKMKGGFSRKRFDENERERRM